MGFILQVRLFMNEEINDIVILYIRFLLKFSSRTTNVSHSGAFGSLARNIETSFNVRALKQLLIDQEVLPFIQILPLV